MQNEPLATDTAVQSGAPNEHGYAVILSLFPPSGKGFANDLKELLRQKNITPKQLSIDMGVHISTVYYWLDARTLPTAGMIYRIAMAVNEPPVTLYNFITEKDAMPRKEKQADT